MKRFFLAILLIICLFLFGCHENNSQKHDSEIQTAIDELKQQWEGIYTNAGNYSDTDGYLEIKNTRLVYIKSEADNVFENVDYVVEFVLFSDYFGAAPYYSDVDIYDTVIFYQDGSIEVSNKNLFSLYMASTFTSDFTSIIDSIEDLGDTYNETFNLK